MKLTDIHIRDPFVLLHEDKYYLYGTRGATCWGEADGFDVYVSEDLENWSEQVARLAVAGGATAKVSITLKLSAQDKAYLNSTRQRIVQNFTR